MEQEIQMTYPTKDQEIRIDWMIDKCKKTNSTKVESKVIRKQFVSDTFMSNTFLATLHTNI